MSAGWGDDRLCSYQTGSEYGYVWKTTWDTPEDATGFRKAFLPILNVQGAENVASGTFVGSDGPYADANLELEADTDVERNGDDRSDASI